MLFAVAFALPEGRLQFALIVAGALFVGGHMGPVAALAAELNHPGLRATALSVVTLVYNLLGLGAWSICRRRAFGCVRLASSDDGYSCGLPRRGNLFSTRLTPFAGRFAALSIELKKTLGQIQRRSLLNFGGNYALHG